MNLKINSHAHLEDEDAVNAHKSLNQSYYSSSDIFGEGGLSLEKVESEKKFQRRHSLHPRL